MGKRRSIWNAKKMVVNFNFKEWRQDFAAYVQEKKYWHETRVTRAKVLDNKFYNKSIKNFEVFNRYGGSVKVSFKNKNEIIDSNEQELINQYLEERRVVL